jgi:epoxyqueuosine reductase
VTAVRRRILLEIRKKSESVETFNTQVGKRFQFYLTPLAGNGQMQCYIGSLQHCSRFLRPLDDADLSAIEFIAKSGVEKFIRAAETVEIEVPYRERFAADGDDIRFDQRVGRALHMAFVPGRVQQGARDGGLAGAELAVQKNHQARRQRARQCGAQCQGAGFIMQEGFEMLHRLESLPVKIHSEAAIMPSNPASDDACAALAIALKGWGRALGFAEIRIADIDLAAAEPGLQAWLDAGHHGEMDYMAAHGSKRARPAELVPGTRRVIVARMDYLPDAGDAGAEVGGKGDDWRARELSRLQAPEAAVISLYARGRDYHKVMRQRLQQLAQKIEEAIGAFGYRVFTDSAPVMEVALAQRAGLGWRGKHTLLLSREAGSMFFLGEIYTDLPLPVDAAISDHCGSCRACIDICPTQAIVAPYRLDARRCISYLTIELRGSIPVALRPLIGNRVYGCDDCQLACPWNKFAQTAGIPDFDVRNGLDEARMADLFGWSAADFDARLQGSPIRRIGHACWLRNLAVGLGNALRVATPDAAREIVAVLQQRADDPSPLVREHVAWALAQRPDALLEDASSGDQ